jgi:hypothetical protein
MTYLNKCSPYACSIVVIGQGSQPQAPVWCGSVLRPLFALAVVTSSSLYNNHRRIGIDHNPPAPIAHRMPLLYGHVVTSSSPYF